MKARQAGQRPFARCKRRFRYSAEGARGLFLWTESRVEQIASDVATKLVTGDLGARTIRERVSEIFKEDALDQLSTEARSATEKLATNAKASFHRKLNSIYEEHEQRLLQRVSELELRLKKQAPDFERRLKAFEEEIEQLTEKDEARLLEPERKLKQMITECSAHMAAELQEAQKQIASQVRLAVQKLEGRLEKIVETRLHAVLLEAVRDHVRSAPIQPAGLTNKQLAAANGISRRAAKRLRRATTAPALNT